MDYRDHLPSWIGEQYAIELYLPESRILAKTTELAAHISSNYKDSNPLFLATLNGAFVFSADLLRKLTILHQVDFLKMKSYAGTRREDNVSEMLFASDVRDRHVIILEDIVDTGNTLEHIYTRLAEEQVASISCCTLLYKPGKYAGTREIGYKGFEIDNDFVIGYGMDLDGYGRSLRSIYQLKEKSSSEES